MAASTPAATVTASTPAATVTAGALAVTSHVAITTITAPPSKPTEPDARSTVVTAADSDDMCRVACVTPNLTAATSHVAVTSATNPFTAFATLPADDDAPPTVAVEPPAVVFTPQPPAPPFAPPLPPLPPLISEHPAVPAVSDAPDPGPPSLPQLIDVPLSTATRDNLYFASALRGDSAPNCSLLSAGAHEPASLLDLLSEADSTGIFDETGDAQPARRARGERKRRRGGKSHAAARRMRDEARAASDATCQQHDV